MVESANIAESRLRSVDLSDEAGERWPDRDLLQGISSHVREALTAALREVSWPHGDVARWRDQAYSARLKAGRLADMLQRPRRLSAVNLPFEYEAACGQIRNDHKVAKVLEPDTPEASEPLRVPTVCPVRLRQILDKSAGVSLAEAIAWPLPSADC